MNEIPHVPLSWGEVIDKITILEIKSAMMKGEALAHVRRELEALMAIAAPMLRGEISLLAAELRALNRKLWEIEDRIRDKEAAKCFDGEFVELARAIYHTNDDRGAMKRRINLALGSVLMEEKTYKPYR